MRWRLGWRSGVCAWLADLGTVLAMAMVAPVSGAGAGIARITGSLGRHAIAFKTLSTETADLSPGMLGSNPNSLDAES